MSSPQLHGFINIVKQIVHAHASPEAITLHRISDVDDIPDAFETFMSEEKPRALDLSSKEENLAPDKLNKVIGNYIFTERKPLPDHIVNILEVKPKILERKSV